MSNNFYIVIFFILAIFSPVISKTHCGEKGDFECFEDSTCCKTPAGYRCFPVYSGSCCVDGTKACSMGEICDSKNGNKCIKSKKE